MGESLWKEEEGNLEEPETWNHHLISTSSNNLSISFQGSSK
ncbi:unnamed protein product [Lathyrus oleraceus]